MQKILLIDDDPDLRETLSSLLELEQYAVTACGTAEEGRAALNKERFNIILVDIFLPDTNGIEFVKEIHEQGINSPVVIITGSSEIELARKAIRLGVFDYLVKPFKNIQFQQVVKNALMQFRLVEEKGMLEKQKQRYQGELEKMVQQKVSELKESEQKYQNLVEQSLVGVYVIQDEKYTYVNRKFCEVFECTSADIIDKKNLLDFADADQRQLVKSNLSRRLSGEKNAGSFKFNARTVKDNKRIVETWAGAVQYQGKPAIEGILIDITAQHESKIRERQFEMELMNEHKLAAVGRLAAGVAHNLNTPISVIQGNAELLKLRHPDIPETEKILKQTYNMSALINQIMEKGRKEQDASRIAININDLLKKELEFLNANLFFKHKVKKNFNLGGKLPRIQGVYSDFSQGLISIVQNAIDAMYEADERTLTIETKSENDQIVVVIKDTGTGIPEKIQSKIFDPFFTTKPKGVKSTDHPNMPAGTGLGLSLAYNLLHPYGVKIDFTTQENKGTTFKVCIPVQN